MCIERPKTCLNSQNQTDKVGQSGETAYGTGLALVGVMKPKSKRVPGCAAQRFRYLSVVCAILFVVAGCGEEADVALDTQASNAQGAALNADCVGSAVVGPQLDYTMTIAEADSVACGTMTIGVCSGLPVGGKQYPIGDVSESGCSPNKGQYAIVTYREGCANDLRKTWVTATGDVTVDQANEDVVSVQLDLTLAPYESSLQNGAEGNIIVRGTASCAGVEAL